MGCGPGKLGELLKNQYYGEECDLHDDMYSEASMSREEVDELFLDSMLNRAHNIPRILQAYLYYYLVRLFGASRWGKK